MTARYFRVYDGRECYPDYAWGTSAMPHISGLSLDDAWREISNYLDGRSLTEGEVTVIITMTDGSVDRKVLESNDGWGGYL